MWARGRLRPLPPRTLLGVPSSARRHEWRARALGGGPGRNGSGAAGTAPVEDVSVATFVGHRVGRAVVDRLVEPLLGGVYAGRADLLSLFATMPQLPASTAH